MKTAEKEDNLEEMETHNGEQEAAVETEKENEKL